MSRMISPGDAPDFRAALLLHQSGQFGRAADIYREILARNPRHSDALHGLGLLEARAGRLESANSLIARSLELQPGNTQFRQNYATILCQAGRHDLALQTCDQGLKSQPKNVYLLYVSAAALLKLKRLPESLQRFDKLLGVQPDHLHGINERGCVLAEMKEYDKALAAFERATNLNPKFVDAYLNIGNLFGQTGRHEEAQSSFEKALALNPRLPRAWSGLGIVLRKRAQFEKALVAFDKALALEPNLVEAWLGCGNVFHDLRRSDEAFAAYDKALSIEPESAEIYTSRGIALHVLMRNEEALWSLNRAIELDFSSALAHFNRSLVLLTLGQYADAWDEYEWRKKLPVPLGNRIFSQPLLERAEIEGATVFVYGEQALGDQIHFCRYVNSLADRGAKVILEAPKLLFQLFKSLDGVSQLVEADQSIPPFDYHCPVMSLPRVFRTTFENIPNKVPYLFADPVKAKVWADKLGAQSRLRIGLVWSGGFRPNQPEVLSTNEKRNIPLAKFAQLKDIDAAFYSLQKGDRAVSELKELARGGWGGPDIIDLTDELNDFSDTAALIENLNLVISVDTSTAHLAGAMAKPVCLLSRFDTDWRWLSNSPWYPTVKPYIQTKAGNWDQVIENLKADLIKINQTRGYS